MRRTLVSFVSLVVVSLASLGTAACSRVAAPELGADADPELIEGQRLYNRSCSSCHGSAGQGALGPKLAAGKLVAAYPNADDQLAVMVDGRAGMPAFGERLSGTELDAIVRYTREVLSPLP